MSDAVIVSARRSGGSPPVSACSDTHGRAGDRLATWGRWGDDQGRRALPVVDVTAVISLVEAVHARIGDRVTVRGDAAALLTD